MAQRQTILVELAYSGLPFHGVQKQPGHRTVASDLQTLLTLVCGEEPRALTFAARTDAGVNAHQNFATCWYPGKRLTNEHLERLQRSEDVSLRILAARFVARSFNARSTASRKHYQYRVHTRVPTAKLQRDAERASTHWDISPDLDLSSMKRAAAMLVGTHDYSAFRAQRCDAKNPVKTIHSFSVEQAQTVFTFDLHGIGFLRHMVRVLVGTVVEVGAGLRSVDSVGSALAAKSRDLAGMTAPAAGLWLMGVTMDGSGHQL
jgi:tRNA pseudouridine38-40 synthase